MKQDNTKTAEPINQAVVMEKEFEIYPIIRAPNSPQICKKSDSKDSNVERFSEGI